MSHFNLASHIHFLKNTELNRFYLSIFIGTFGVSLINIFVPIYLYNIGYEVYEILFFFFLISLYFVLMSYVGAKIVARVGEKHAMLYGAPPLMLFYLGFVFLESLPFLFFILPIFMTIHMVLFNYGYHLSYFNNSNESKRGRELALLGMLTLFATASAPYFGSILAEINFTVLFIVSAVFVIGGTIPLLFSRDIYEKVDFSFSHTIKYILAKENRNNFISFSGYAIESIIGKTIWPIFLFILLKDLNTTGFIVSLTMVLSILVFIFIGKLTDKFDRINLLRFATVLYFFAWVGRIFVDTVGKLIFIDSYRNFSEKVLHIPWTAHGYDLASKGSHFEFIVSRELIFNIIRIIVFPLLIFIFWFDFYPFITSFIIASVFSLGYLFTSE